MDSATFLKTWNLLFIWNFKEEFFLLSLFINNFQKKVKTDLRLKQILTNYSSIFHFYNPWKRQKTWTLEHGTLKMLHWTKMGNWFHITKGDLNINWLVWLSHLQSLLKTHCIKMVKDSLHKNCLNTEFFLVRILPYLDWIRRFTTYIFVFSPNAGK